VAGDEEYCRQLEGEYPCSAEKSIFRGSGKNVNVGRNVLNDITALKKNTGKVHYILLLNSIFIGVLKENWKS
jgi:hypothetical protein